ncbi:MAG: hypothetical protein M1820_006829 [Bogoriella megaspora]|nr:MAG: hypothetical protein M1820_006829 [Bogoriella megaspora]
MFPDKVGKMVLDGVTNGHEYFSGRNKEWIVDTDGAVQGFLSSCIAAKSSCPLTNHGNSTSVLTSKILQKLEQLKQNPATVAGQQVTYAGTKSFIWQQSYHPYAWPVVAQSLDHFLNGKYEAFQAVQASLSKDESPFPKTSNDALSAISCGDYAWRTADFEEIKQYANEMEAKSIFGGLTGLPQEIDCAAWRFQAKERYQGDFHVQTRNPILFVGNTHDPVTPYASAKNMSTGFDGSVLLHHDGYGHCSNAQPSICTANNIRAYWQDGSLPSEGTYCEPEYPPFVSTQNQDEIVVPALSSRALKPRSEDDKALLEAVETLGRLQSKAHRSQWKV